ncbi:MAG: sugar ABC transporter ATP-binding protein [Planifilum fulgidum]
MVQDHRPILQVREIHKVFPGTKALSNVSMEFHAGEVHAVVGENGAGKSTLMNILSGVFPPTEGQIILEGEEVRFQSPRQAQEKGIAIVHQELSLCPHLTVGENMFIGRLPRSRLGFVDRNKLREDAKKMLEAFKADIDPDDLAGDLSISEQQVVEIAKALTMDCKVLILDEPTSAITESEANNLFEVIRELRGKGICIIYISHRIKEIFSISDRISVLRDGHYIGTYHTEEMTPDRVVQLMVGRELKNIYPPKSTRGKKEILRVENLSREGVFHQIRFTLYEKEVLGIFGLVGAGRTEMSRALCGIDPKDSGQVWLDGKPVAIDSVSQAIQQGIVYLTEDRKNQGLFLDLSVKRNIVSSNLQAVSSGLFIDPVKEKKMAEHFSEKLNVKTPSLDQSIGSLSGGNQQKAMIAKWLSTHPKVLLLDEPTRGIDVGAKSEIYKMLRELADDGKGIIVISSELPEVIGICDRVLVMHQGRIVGEVSGERINEEEIIRLASGIVA